MTFQKREREGRERERERKEKKREIAAVVRKVPIDQYMGVHSVQQLHTKSAVVIKVITQSLILPNSTTCLRHFSPLLQPFQTLLVFRRPKD